MPFGGTYACIGCCWLQKRTAPSNPRDILVILLAGVAAAGLAVLGYRQVDPFAKALEGEEAQAARVLSVGVHVH